MCRCMSEELHLNYLGSLIEPIGSFCVLGQSASHPIQIHPTVQLQSLTYPHPSCSASLQESVSQRQTGLGWRLGWMRLCLLFDQLC